MMETKELQPLRSQPRTAIIWWGALALALGLGMAANNARVTQSAVTQEKGDCHWQLRHEAPVQLRSSKSQ